MTEAVRAGLAREVLVSGEVRETQGFRALDEQMRSSGVDVRTTDRESIDEVVRGADHQGVAARVRLPAMLGEADLTSTPFPDDAIVVLLDGITDPQNLGAAARSAEAAGADMLVTRERRSAPVTPAAVRASAGALLHLPHARVTNLSRAIQRIKEMGFTVVGLSEAAEVSVQDAPAPAGKLAVVVGSEGEGISRLVREHCDALVRLPMRGSVGSLNASAALAAVLYAYVLPSRGDA